ncbi:MAG: hypothetical protein AAF944_17335 [Bacteroidota bacterium]
MDSAPFVLAMTTYVIGRVVQRKERIARQHIVDSEKKLYEILQRNPDAIFLVRTNDSFIEQYNRMALQLCDIDKESDLNTYAPLFFTSLSKSLSILTQLKSEGDIFSTVEPITTAKGRAFWGQISVYVFSINNYQYQLIRITDISPSKQRELELEKMKVDLQQHSEELELANEEITAINNNLEYMIKERTNLLSRRNAQLTEYAFLNAHKIRGPLTRILGSAYALEHASHEKEYREFIHHVVASAKELDQVIHQIAKTLNVVNDEQIEEMLNEIKAPSSQIEEEGENKK